MTSKTITLTGAEIRADYSGGANAWLRNDGAVTIYASTTPGVTAGADGVVSVPAGQAAAIYDAYGTVYLLGTGSVQLVGSDYTACPFKTSAQSGGSGADEVARAAIEAHEADTDIHVTAAEKAGWDGLSNQNLLINPDFAINQRGSTSYTAAGYTADRWKIVDTTSCELISSGGIRITAAEQSSDIPARAVQVIDNVAALAGKKCTLSCEVLATTAAHAALFFATYSSDGNGTYKGKTGLSVGVNQYTADIPADTTAIQIWLISADTRVGDTAGMHTDFAWAKLEFGGVATPFTPPDPATELLKCQRYYWDSGKGVYGAPGAYSVSTADMTSLGDGTKAAFCNVKFPVEMRIKPTVTIVSYDGTKNAVSNWASGDTIDGTVIAGSANLSSAGIADVRLPDAITDIIGFHVVANAEL